VGRSLGFAVLRLRIPSVTVLACEYHSCWTFLTMIGRDFMPVSLVSAYLEACSCSKQVDDLFVCHYPYEKMLVLQSF